jgi:hypothetical protein
VRRVDCGDVAQDARPQREPVECVTVASQRRLGRGAADQVVPRIAVELLVCGADQFVQRKEITLGLT